MPKIQSPGPPAPPKVCQAPGVGNVGRGGCRNEWSPVEDVEEVEEIGADRQFRAFSKEREVWNVEVLAYGSVYRGVSRPSKEVAARAALASSGCVELRGWIGEDPVNPGPGRDSLWIQPASQSYFLRSVF